MIDILAEKIHDNRFLRLVRNMLTAGYLEDWRYNATLSGAPQGGVASPILSSIYLHKLDAYVETVLIPQHTQGTLRRANAAHSAIRQALYRARRRGDRAAARNLQRRMRSMPSQDPNDPGYRRLRYTRYADDHLLGFTGPKAEAEQIKDQLATFLRDELKLELNPDKTLVTHARTRAARYLGYEIITQHSDTKITRGRRSVNGTITLRETPHGKRTCFEARVERTGKQPLVARSEGYPLHANGTRRSSTASPSRSSTRSRS